MISHPVSQAVLNWNQTVTTLAAPNATDDCVTWPFRLPISATI